MALRRARQCVELGQSLDRRIISEFTLAVDWMQDWTIHRHCKLDERALQSQLARQLNIEVANASVRRQRFLVTCEYKIPTGPSCDDIKKAVELAGQRFDYHRKLSMAHDIIVRVDGEHVTVTTEAYPDFVLELKRALEARRFEKVLRGGGQCALGCGRYSARDLLGCYCCHLCMDSTRKMRREEHTGDCDVRQTQRTERLNRAPPISVSREPDVAILMACQVEVVDAISSWYHVDAISGLPSKRMLMTDSCLQAIADSVGSKRARLHGQFKETTCEGRFVCDYLGGQRCGCFICGTKAM